MNIEIITWDLEEMGVRVYHDGDSYTPETMPDEIVDFLVGLLERWEARRVGL